MIRKPIRPALRQALQSPALVRALMAGGGGAAALPALSSFALVGDSLTQGGNSTVTLNVTATRTANVVAVPKANHGIPGPSTPVYLANCTDASFEGLYTATYVNANNLSLSGGPAGPDGTTAVGVLVQQNRYARRGSWAWLQAAKAGGLRFLASLGQGGDSAEHMTGALTQALDTNPDAVILAAGINNVFAGGQSTATAWANIKALIDQVTAAGKVAVCCAVTPVNSAAATWTAPRMIVCQEVNALMSAYCNVSNRVYVDSFTPLYDSVSNGAYSWATYDNTHWTIRSAQAIGNAIALAIAANTVDAPVMLPVSSTDTGAPNGWTRQVLKGPWTTATGGTFGAGITGTAPAGSTWTRTTSGTGTASIVDPGDGKGMFAQAVFTPGAVNEDLQFWPWSTAHPTIASLGLTTTDTVILGCEVQWSGANAANMGSINMVIDSRTSAVPFASNSNAGDGVSGEVGARFPDSGETIFMTGPLKLDAAVSNLQLHVDVRFTGASASAATIKYRQFCLFKL